MPTPNQSPTKSDFEINTTQLADELTQACLNAKMIDSAHVPFVTNMLLALFGRDVAALEREMAAYKDNPEDIYLPLKALCHVWGHAVNDFSMEGTCAGFLALGATSDADEDRPLFSKWTGEINYRLVLFTDKGASGYKRYLDDRYSGVRDRRSHDITGQEALDGMVPLFLAKVLNRSKKVQSVEDKMSHVFGIFPGPQQLNTTLAYRQSVRFEKGLRDFISNRETAKLGGRLAYWTWRWENRRDVKTYERTLKLREKYKEER